MISYRRVISANNWEKIKFIPINFIGLDLKRKNIGLKFQKDWLELKIK